MNAARIDRDSLLGLETYARTRAEFRARIIPHRRSRTVHLGEHVTLQFEDEQTLRYQIQEMLRIERIFEEQGIRDEIEVYGALLPDGANWKATMLIEYTEVEERRRELARLVDIEDRVWVCVAGHARVFAIADEDLARETGEKTSAVHFLRFELTPEMRRAALAGTPLSMGVDHPHYRAETLLDDTARTTLLADLKP